MRKESDDQLDPNQPALIVTYGHTTRKYRPLERDVVVLGRAPGCDLGLASPEVAPVHCVLALGPDGWHIRDCSGRAGTRVNGSPIVEGLLRHGDTLQVGTFSFEAHLPALPTEEPARAAPLAKPFVSVSTASVAEFDMHAQNKSLADEENRLRIRSQELDRFAEHLQRRRKELDVLEETKSNELAEAQETIKHLQERLEHLEKSDATRLADEVNRLRQELDAEHDSVEEAREELQRERSQLMERQADFEEAARETELQMSRERAQLARDRSELMRLRDEIRFEQQRMHREIEVIDALEPVRKLKDELASKSDPGTAVRPVVSGSSSHPNAPRWRNLRPLSDP